MANLFYDTVHTINAKDYSKAQLDVWATGNIDLEVWDKTFIKHTTYVVEVNELIVGFGDMNSLGYLDRLYVHKDYQGKGIATSIVDALESELSNKGVISFYTYASVSAMPFFQRRGYKVVRENIVVKGGVEIMNYEMKK